jgi:hypothetical protein
MSQIINSAFSKKFLISILMFFSVNAVCFAQLFTGTWVGYNVGDVTNARFPYGAVLKDFNGDSTLDIAVCLWPWATGFNVVFRQSNGDFSQPVHYNSTNPPVDITSADIDKDGWPDIVISNTGSNWEGATISYFRNLGNGSFASEQQFTVGAGPVGIVAADFDNDTYIDIAVANDGYNGQGSTVSILKNNHSGGFQNQTVVSAGPSPYKLAAGDLNNDGFADIVVANEFHQVTVIMNNGSGGFLPGVTYQTNFIHWAGAVYPAVAIADIDKDNMPDVLYSNTKTIVGDNAVIALFHNLGGGVLGNQTAITLDLYSNAPVSLAAVDLNNDTWIDVVGATDFYTFSVALNNGSGGFLPSTRYPAGQIPNTIFAEDINHDGYKDILTIDNNSMEITYHKNLGNGTFPVPPTFIATFDELTLDAADIDLDGDLDIVTSGNGGITGVPASVLKNNGNGTFQAPVNYNTSNGTMFAKFRKLNNDNYPDLLFGKIAPYDFGVAMNNGDGTFGPVVTYSVNSCGWGDIDAFDIDGDGDLDVVICEADACPGITESGLRVYFSKNNGDGTFAAPYYIVIDPNPYTITAGDFNRDGKLDLATANWGTYGANNWIDVIMGNGDGTWQSPVLYEVGQGPNGIVTADFNHDSILDIATCNSGSGGLGAETMSVLLGNPDGSFQPAVTLYGSYSADLLGTTGITAGDVNRDGNIDLMVSNYGSNDISIYINNGAGQFDFKYRYGAGWAAEWPFYADFTGDGVKDIAVTVATPHPGSLIRSVAIIKGNENLIGIDPGSNNEIPVTFILSQNYPNPFNPATLIKYSISKVSNVKLIVYDILGREVKRLVNNEIKSAGNYIVEFNGQNYTSGVYFYRIEAEQQDGKKFVESKKMVLIK